MNVTQYNRDAWNHNVKLKIKYTKPVDSLTIKRARRGLWNICLTDTLPMPQHWLPEIKDKSILCLASGGGQQGPILAAAGAKVTVLDISSKQLEQDRKVAARENLELHTLEGDMCDLTMFENNCFDIIVHPVSNVFVENIQPVWLEAYRVLKTHGILVAGITNPVVYLFDQHLIDEGIFVVKNSLPYSDLVSLPEDELQYYKQEQIPLEFGHTLEQQLGGLCRAGFVIADLYEDDFNGKDALDPFMKSLMAFKAVKL